eukprot:scaffold238804_cov24-Prasinocladus_malaysianus.AAC.1
MARALIQPRQLSPLLALLLLSTCLAGIANAVDNGLRPLSTERTRRFCLIFCLILVSIAALAVEVEYARLHVLRQRQLRQGARGRGRSRNRGARKAYWREDGFIGNAARRAADPHGNAAPWERFNVPPCQISSTKAADFRQEFRISHSMFWEIYQRCKASGVFPDVNGNVNGTMQGTPTSLALKILAALRCLALGTSFDAHSKESGIGKSTLRNFVPRFYKWFDLEYNAQWLQIPTTEDELEELQRPFAEQGLPGCICSMDGVHIAWDNCPAPDTGKAKGKEHYTTVVFNVCSSHTRRILHVSGPFYGTVNDKSMVRVDHFVDQVRTGALFVNYCFKIFTAIGVEVFLKGAWILVDGGYHKWRATICAMESCKTENERKCSSHYGSIRKDVERCFGTLKKRFRILKVPFHVAEAESIGCVFRTCAILHNMLLNEDGLSEIGQADDHYTQQTVNPLNKAAMQKGLHEEQDDDDVDYFELGEAWLVDDIMPHREVGQFLRLQRALCNHYIISLISGNARRLKTAKRLREEAELDD